MQDRTPGDSATTAQVLRRFRIVFNTARNHFQRVERQVGLGGAQVWALSVIRSHPGIGVSGIAHTMAIHQSTASNLVKVLLQRGLVRLDRTPEDRRSVKLYILPAGQKMLDPAAGPFEGVLPLALGKLPHDTLQRLDQDLGELIRFLQADDEAAGIPLAEL